MNQAHSVLCLTAYQPMLTASVRYRIMPYAPALAAAGIELRYVPFATPRLQRLLYQPKRYPQKMAALLSSLIQWLAKLPRQPAAVIVQREAALIGAPIIERWFSRRVPVIFDFDDAIFLPTDPKRSINGWLSRLARPTSKTDQLLSFSRMVWAGNSYLADYARRFNQHVHVIPTVVDCQQCQPRSVPNSQICTLGWIGSHSTARYLEQLRPVLSQLAERYRFRLLVVGTAQAIEIAGVECLNLDWQQAREWHDFQQIDIGLYPIEADLWAEGKCGLKAIQYGAAAIPSVCSAVGVNQQIIEHGQTGFLANNTAEWAEYLGRLLEDGQLRQQMGQAARQKIEAEYSVQRYQTSIVTALKECLCVESAASSAQA
ncbi:glycosyltransferase family 4 protein [Herpetosiphon sp. NSE202]|uniref:glycosyltransferase family 4 protein n=1 Tax=Herpetosiphon sp. NSE202 TaxID=3351349 RepID=UPI003630D632